MKTKQTTARALAAAFITTGITMSALTAHAQVVYNSLPPSPTYNVPSLGYEATSTSEFGDNINLAGGSQSISSITVGLSDWATASTYLNSNGTVQSAYQNIASSLSTSGYNVPLTLNVYSVNTSGTTPTVGSLLTTQTVNALVPWRPENNTAADPSGYQAADGNIYHGLYFTQTFNLNNVTLPGNVIVTLALDTTNFGTSPTGVLGPYDSLNFATAADGPSVGTETDPGTVFLSSTDANTYGDGGATGVLRENAGWTGLVPVIEVQATPEPASYALGLVAIAALIGLRRFKPRTV